jgi:hypothetical protein
MPERIQRKRTKGWRTPLCGCGCGKQARFVGRGTPYGNPFRIGTVIDRVAMGRSALAEIAITGAEQAVEAYRQWLGGRKLLSGGHDLAPLPPTAEQLTALRGHDLVCWCPLSSPCHADVLLEVVHA